MARADCGIGTGDTFGWRLRKARNQGRLTQREVAELAGVGREAVAALERGVYAPKLETAVRLWEALRHRLPDLDPTRFLAGQEAVPPRTVPATMNRREFIATSGSLLGAAMVTVDLERLASTAAPDAAVLDNWEERTANLAAARPLQPPRELLPALEQHLWVLRSRIADGSCPAPLRPRLLSIAAATCAQAAWVSLMAERRADARDHLVRGEQLAGEAGDETTMVLLLTVRADMCSAVCTGGGEGSPERALESLGRADALATATTPVVLRAAVALRRAEEEAFAGHADAAMRQLDVGARIAASGRPPDSPLRPFWPPWAVPSFVGSAFGLLGRPEAALAALAPIESGHALHRPLVLADLAAAHALAGDMTTAVATLSAAVDQAEATGNHGCLRRCKGVHHRRLAPWRDERSVRALGERLL